MAEPAQAAQRDASDWDDEPDACMALEPQRAEPILSQAEIDSLLGIFRGGGELAGRSGVRAIIGSTPVSHERLPMLEIVFGRMARLMTTSLRNFTSGNVEVSIEQTASITFGDYLDFIPPAIVGVFRAERLDNFGLVTVDSNLIHSVADAVLRSSRGAPTRVEARPYTISERMLVTRMIDLVLADARRAFSPLTELDFKLDRIETDSRFAANAGPTDAALVVKLRIDMENGGGRLELVLPYSEPLRKLLLLHPMGEKLGRDSIWEGHLASELWAAKIEVRAVLDELKQPLRKVLDLKVGHTLMLNALPDAQVKLKCGAVDLSLGRVGRMGHSLAVRIERPIAPAARNVVAKLGGAS